jgi:hypothetical protein
VSKKSNYEDRVSEIHGKGVFATKKIKKGKKIIEYTGKVITWEEANRRFNNKNAHSHTMFFGIDEDHVIDGNDGGNEARFINHSCTPNCKTKNKNGRIFVYSKKDIKKGQELFYDYKLDIEEPVTKAILKKYSCFCGTKKCRGTQLDEKYLNKILKK